MQRGKNKFTSLLLSPLQESGNEPTLTAQVIQCKATQLTRNIRIFHRNKTDDHSYSSQKLTSQEKSSHKLLMRDEWKQQIKI